MDNNSTQIESDSIQSKNIFVGDSQEDTFSGDLLEEIAREQRKILISDTLYFIKFVIRQFKLNLKVTKEFSTYFNFFIIFN